MSNSGNFKVFDSQTSRMMHVPTVFFEQLLPGIENRDELCLLLLIFDAISNAEHGAVKIDPRQMAEDPQVMANFGGEVQRLHDSLQLTVDHGALIVLPQLDGKDFYLLNTADNQALAEQIGNGSVSAKDLGTVSRLAVKPNIYQLYEENIGLLTPIAAEMLKDDEQEFSADWIRDAIHIAVERNARNWKYVRAILKSWQKEGRDGKNIETSESIRKKYRDSWLGKNKGK